jgi:hypothetical protein
MFQSLDKWVVLVFSAAEAERLGVAQQHVAGRRFADGDQTAARRRIGPVVGYRRGVEPYLDVAVEHTGVLKLDD